MKNNQVRRIAELPVIVGARMPEAAATKAQVQFTVSGLGNNGRVVVTINYTERPGNKSGKKVTRVNTSLYMTPQKGTTRITWTATANLGWTCDPASGTVQWAGRKTQVRIRAVKPVVPVNRAFSSAFSRGFS